MVNLVSTLVRHVRGVGLISVVYIIFPIFNTHHNTGAMTICFTSLVLQYYTPNIPRYRIRKKQKNNLGYLSYGQCAWISLDLSARVAALYAISTPGGDQQRQHPFSGNVNTPQSACYELRKHIKPQGGPPVPALGLMVPWES